MHFKRREMLNRLSGLSLMLILTGCETMTGSGGTDKAAPIAATTTVKGDRKPFVYCGASGPFRWSVADTAETIKQAKIQNAKWIALCGTSGVPSSKPTRP
ncbi:MAG: hypothetical protein ABJN98_24000 [Roseibium sp.]